MEPLHKNARDSTERGSCMVRIVCASRVAVSSLSHNRSGMGKLPIWGGDMLIYGFFYAPGGLGR